MTETTEDLIGRLAAGAEPVRRLRGPCTRACLWIGGFAILAVAGILWFSDLPEAARRLEEPKLAVELLATLATGLLAVVAAFQLSLPDRSARWALLPLPALAVWLATSGHACYRYWVVRGSDGWKWGESAECFQFILGFGIPMAIALLLALRRAHPLNPERVAAVGGLGTAALAAFLLQFFHPFDVTFLDLAVHAVAVSIVVVASSASARLPAAR